MDRDINITLGDDIPMGDVADTTKKVLIGRVRGRNYSVECLCLWTSEIWGSLLKQLPIIKVLAHGWFSIHFHSEEYID